MLAFVEDGGLVPEPEAVLGQGVGHDLFGSLPRYVAKFDEAVYVLHAFQKKTQKTAKLDLDLARNRYQALINERIQR